MFVVCISKKVKRKEMCFYFTFRVNEAIGVECTFGVVDMNTVDKRMCGNVNSNETPLNENVFF